MTGPRRFVRLGVLLTVGMTVMSVGSATAEPSGPSVPDGSSTLGKDQRGAVVQVVPKIPVPVPPGAPRRGDAGAMAKSHASWVADEFGAVVGNLFVDKVFRVGSGSTVRLRQEIDAVPVFGSSVAQSLTADGALLSVTGALSRRSVGAYPAAAAPPPPAVGRTALASIAAQTRRPVEKLSVARQQANWYDPTLAAVADAESIAMPAYRVEVAGGNDATWTVFVDAVDTGRVFDSWSNEKHSNRVVCDANRQAIDTSNATSAETRCGDAAAFTPARAEGQAAVGKADVDNVYAFLGDTQAFYRRYTPLAELGGLIGGDTGDGRGKALRATVRLCDISQCPWANAFWTEDHMAYGEGITTDDITGHELTHGVTQNVNGLVYRNESGAINESMSDIFGEFTDLTNGSPDDTPRNRWLIGEGSSVGAIRDMNNPRRFRNPDTYRGADWYTGLDQSAFVHVNSGVGNKVAQLITDGGTVNGRTVTGIGLSKAAGLYWTAQTLLPSSARYATLSSTLATACAQNVANKVADTAPADCTQVVGATQATRLPVLGSD